MSMNRIFAGALLCSTSFVFVTAAHAQASPAADQPSPQAAPSETVALNDGDIVVTARKRDERLQDVPESISVLSGAQIDRGNINSLKDFVALTPNIVARSTFRSNETFLTMRGIASAQGALPPVSIIVDGVQLGSNDFINQDLLDVERIEVLRGPQGALYGQGAIAGAINIVTRKPTNEFTGFAKGTYGTGNTYRIAGAISGPLIKDTLLFRVSAYQRGTDGLIKNARGQRLDGGSQSSVRAQLLLDANPLQINLRGSYTKGDGGCCNQDRAGVDAAGNILGVDDVTNPGATSNILGTEDTRFRDASGRIDYDFGPVTLTSITGWADVTQQVYGDFDFTAAALTAQKLTYSQDVFNQDLRLASNGDGALSWIVGGFYQRRNESQRLLVGTEIPGDVIPTIANQDIRKQSKSQAVYGQVSYEITPKLELLGALRYDWDKETNVNRLNPGPTAAEAKFRALQPKAQLSYKITPDIMIYATYSQGFRAGGFSQTTLFDNEKTKNFEAGFKTQFAEGRVSINGSAFHIDYQNQLLSYVVTSGTAAIRRTINIPQTSIDGFELELSARPTNRLTTSVNVGFTDSVVKKVAPDPVIATAGAVGKKSPLVAPFTMSASATYRAPVSEGLDLVAYGVVQHRGGFFFDLTNTIYTATKTFVDGSLTLDAGAWSVGVFGKNLTNARNADNVSITGSRLRTPNQPRSYGVQASYRF
jgi:iron complex outermembrane receptor protein